MKHIDATNIDYKCCLYGYDYLDCSGDSDHEYKFKYCPNCGRKIIED